MGKKKTLEYTLEQLRHFTSQISVLQLSVLQLSVLQQEVDSSRDYLLDVMSALDYLYEDAEDIISKIEEELE